MRFLLILCMGGGLVAADSMQLVGDKSYADKLQAVLARKPDGKDPKALYLWLWDYSFACIENRDYASAEIADRALLALAPQYSVLHCNLSVELGKQGKYQEALQEAEIAKLLDPGDGMQADEVACSWLYCLGRKQEAIDRFRSIAIPTEAPAVGAYYRCKACFFASVGDGEQLRTAIAMALKVDPERRVFFERDIIFDKYRAEPWFIELLGKTLK